MKNCVKFLILKKPENMKLMSKLPKDDYDRMVAACDVGLIFLDHRFTIPNFPSRLLLYTAKNFQYLQLLIQIQILRSNYSRWIWMVV